MIPLESMQVGVPCIVGDNNHYFTNTNLEKYLVVKAEDSIDEIADDVKIDVYEVADGSCYRSDYGLMLYGDKMFIMMEFEFRITETGVKSILRGVNV